MARLFFNRVIAVRIWDKHGDPSKRRRGSSVDRKFVMIDTGNPNPVEITDQDGEDGHQFLQRATADILRYLDDLGQSEWRVIQWTPPSMHVTERTWPIGTHLLVREVS
jgi:hypothetical protein